MDDKEKVSRVFTLKERLSEDLGNMSVIMERTADHCDIWQDRFIYWMAKALWDILEWILRKEK